MGPGLNRFILSLPLHHKALPPHESEAAAVPAPGWGTRWGHGSLLVPAPAPCSILHPGCIPAALMEMLIPEGSVPTAAAPSCSPRTSPSCGGCTMLLPAQCKQTCPSTAAAGSKA